MNRTDMGKYKAFAGFGTILMGIGSFMSCLADTKTFSAIGTAILIISIIIMSYGFYHWRP